jgi:hypothetical protein
VIESSDLAIDVGAPYAVRGFVVEISSRRRGSVDDKIRDRFATATIPLRATPKFGPERSPLVESSLTGSASSLSYAIPSY